MLEIERMPLAEAIDKAFRGEIHDAKSAVALMRAGRVVGSGPKPSARPRFVLPPDGGGHGAGVL